MLGAISKVESEILTGVSQIVKCSDAQVDTVHMSLPVWLGGLGTHLLSVEDGAACDAALLAAATLTHHAVSAGSEHFDPFKGASGVELSALWSDVYDRVVPCMSASSVSTLGVVLTDAMVADVLPTFVHLCLLSLPRPDGLCYGDELTLRDRRRVQGAADVTAETW